MTSQIIDASKNIYKLITQISHDGYVVIHDDPEGWMLYVSEQLLEMFVYVRGELEGQPVEMLLPERFREVHRRHREQFSANPMTRDMGGDCPQLVGLHRDGHEFPIQVGLGAVAQDGLRYHVAVIRNAGRRDVQ